MYANSKEYTYSKIEDTPACLTLRERLRTHKVFTKDQCFYLNYHKFSIKSYVICFECVLESPRRGDSNTHPQHMILWRNIENYPFLSF